MMKKLILLFAALLLNIIPVSAGSVFDFFTETTHNKIAVSGKINLPYADEVSVYLLNPGFALEDISPLNFKSAVRSLWQVEVVNGRFYHEFVLDNQEGTYKVYVSAYGVDVPLMETVNFAATKKDIDYYVNIFRSGTYADLEKLLMSVNRDSAAEIGIAIDDFLSKGEMARKQIINDIINEREYTTDNIIEKFNGLTNNWAQEEINLLAQMPLPVLDNSQDLTNSVSVVDFVKMTLRAMNRPCQENDSAEIELAKELGIILPDEFTDYNSLITKYDSARIIVRSMKEEFTDYIYDCQNDIYNYQNLPEEHREYVLKAFAKGIMDGKNDGDFCGNDNITFEEAAVVMLRRIDRMSRIERIPFYAYKKPKPYPEEIMNWSEADKLRQIDAMNSLRESLNAAVGRGDSYFKIQPGNYRIAEGTGSNIYIENAENLVIYGTGATFWLPPSKGFRINNCSNLTIKGLTIDNDPLPYTQGTILEVDYTNFTVDIEYDTGFKSFEGDLTGKSGERRVWIYDKDGILLKHQTVWDVVNSVEGLGDNRYRVNFNTKGYFSYPWQNRTFTFSEFQTQVEVGQKIVFGLGEAPGQSILVTNCSNFVLDSVTSYSSSAMNFVITDTNGMHIKNNSFKRRPDTGRLFSSLADSMHVAEVNGDVLVENNEFSFAGDDSLAFAGRMFLVYKKLSDNEYLIWDRSATSTNPANKFTVGESFDIYDFKTTEFLGRLTVASSEQETDTTLLADAALTSQRISGNNYYFNSFGECALWKVGFEQTDTQLKEFDFVAHSQNKGESFGAVIRYNYFHDTIGRLLNPTGKTVLHNVFERSGVVSQRFEHTTCGYGMPRNTVIRNNTFIDTGAPGDPNRIPESTINTNVLTATYFNTPAYTFAPIKDISITDNLFIRPADSAVTMSNVDGGTITGNTVISPTAKMPNGGYDFWYGADLSSAFALNAVKNMTYGNNKILMPSEYYTDELFVTANVRPENIDIVGNGFSSVGYSLEEICNIILAQYHEGKLVDLAMKSNVSGDQTLTTNNAIEFDKVKIFIWENFTTLAPLH